MPRWTPESRAEMAMKVKRWQPWRNATGPKTPDGKARDEPRPNRKPSSAKSALARLALIIDDLD